MTFLRTSFGSRTPVPYRWSAECAKQVSRCAWADTPAESRRNHLDLGDGSRGRGRPRHIHFAAHTRSPREARGPTSAERRAGRAGGDREMERPLGDERPPLNSLVSWFARARAHVSHTFEGEGARATCISRHTTRSPREARGPTSAERRAAEALGPGKWKGRSRASGLY